MATLLPMVSLTVIVAIAVVIVGAFAVARKALYSVPGAQGGDAVELRNYVHTFARTLTTLGVSRAARRRHVEELKANLADAVGAAGARAALDGLGPAGALATGYADYRPRPAWLVGVGASTATLAVTWFVHVQLARSYADGWSDALGLTGGSVAGNIDRINEWGIHVTGVMEAGHDMTVTATSPWLWLLPSVAFFVASRSWRALTVRNAATVKA